MAAQDSTERSPRAQASIGQTIKRTGLFLLFGTILFIPRIRRMRRRVWAWTSVRVVAAGGGTWLLWRYALSRASVGGLAAGIAFIVFALFVRSKLEARSIDILARDLNALIVLNGGTFRPSPDSQPVARSQIFVHPEQIIVAGPRAQRLLDIPLAKVRNLQVRAMSNGSAEGRKAWELEIYWTANGPCIATFQYEGVFAEHLAQVAESTLRSQWTKDLPIIRH